MSTLYALSTEFAGLMQADELTDEMMERIDSLAISLEQKVENICKINAQMSMMTDGIDKEIKRLQARKTAMVNATERLKEYTIKCLELADVQTLESGTFKVSLAKKPASVQIEDESLVPAAFFDIKPTINKTRVKEAIQAGEAVPGCKLESNGFSLRIK